MRALSSCGFHSRAGWVVFKSFVRVYSVPSGIWLLMMKNQNTVLSYSKDPAPFSALMSSVAAR